MSKLDIKQKVLVIFFLSLPFVDLLTSISTRFLDASITIGIIVRGLSLLFSLVYVLRFSKCKYRKHASLYLIVICVFAALYFLTKPDIWQISSLVTEIMQAFKFLYFPIMTICLYIIFRDFKISPKLMKTIIFIDCMIYSLLLIIPHLTGTDFPSYEWIFAGSTGWFFAANEIGAILVMLSISILYLIDNKHKYKLLFAIPIIYGISLLGTKVAFIGIIATVVVSCIVFILRTKKNRFLLPGILLVVLVVVSLNSAAYYNMHELSGMESLPSTRARVSDIPCTELETVPSTEIVPEADVPVDTPVDAPVNTPVENPVTNTEMAKLIKSNKLLSVINQITSWRLLYLMENYPYFVGNGLPTLLFGLGWAPRTAITYDYHRILIEIDIFDILLHYGVLGFLVYFAPYIFLAYKVFRHLKDIPLEAWAHIFAILLGFGISCVAGHVLGAPSVSIYMILLIILVIRQTRVNINKQ
ncbi:MAG: O-antigen ligase family protein [Agathobacter sp.]|nr:O-antigen ligase family protein [Agathobacter sp.]